MITTTQTVQTVGHQREYEVYSVVPENVDFKEYIQKLVDDYKKVESWFQVGDCIYFVSKDKTGSWKKVVERYKGMPSWIAGPTIAMENARTIQQAQVGNVIWQWNEQPLLRIDVEKERLRQKIEELKTEVIRLRKIDWDDTNGLDKLQVLHISSPEKVESNQRLTQWAAKEIELLRASNKELVRLLAHWGIKPKKLEQPEQIQPGQCYRNKTDKIYVVLRLHKSDEWIVVEFPYNLSLKVIGGSCYPNELFTSWDIKALTYIGSISDLKDF